MSAGNCAPAKCAHQAQSGPERGPIRQAAGTQHAPRRCDGTRTRFAITARRSCSAGAAAAIESPAPSDQPERLDPYQDSAGPAPPPSRPRRVFFWLASAARHRDGCAPSPSVSPSPRARLSELRFFHVYYKSPIHWHETFPTSWRQVPARARLHAHLRATWVAGRELGASRRSQVGIWHLRARDVTTKSTRWRCARASRPRAGRPSSATCSCSAPHRHLGARLPRPWLQRPAAARAGCTCSCAGAGDAARAGAADLAGLRIVLATF